MKTLLELVKQALEHEVKASAFYDKAAEMTDDDEARMFFLELVDIEEGHCLDLIRIFSKEGTIPENEIRSYHDELCESVQANIGMEEFATVKTGGLKEVLIMAVGFEQKAIQTYTGLYESISNQKLKGYCEKLLEEERRHEKTLTTLLDNLDMELEEYPAL